ncbi:MAG: hypothetical protein HOG60_05610 [Gammaproteobacteria bacterium]|nr:hypothetical protein [Gammaproteobacteria bacterium]
MSPSQWFPEYTYEPYRLMADPAINSKKFATPAQPGKCCDASTVCPLKSQTPCIMQNRAGWVKAALPLLGVADSNADCGFGGDAGVTKATVAATLLAADHRGKNVAL